MTCPYKEPTTNIRKNSLGTGAKWVQWYLSNCGYNISIDGIFGKQSVEALISFQKASMLEADGICGEKTRNALKAKYAVLSGNSENICPYTEPTTNIKYGAKGDGVKWLQWYLVKRGAKLTIDGEFGNATRTALKDFQASAGIEIDGICGAMTRQALKYEQIQIKPKPITQDDAKELIAYREAIVSYCEKQIGSMYVYGSQGQTDVGTIDWSARCFPNYTTSTRAARMKKFLKDNPTLPNGEPMRMHDCSGLIWSGIADAGFDVVKGKKISDSTAAGLYQTYCVPISKNELKVGDLVFTEKLDHVAIVGRDGTIIECAGSDVGCVLNKDVNTRVVKSVYGTKYGCSEYYQKSPWTKFGRLKRFYEAGI